MKPDINKLKEALQKIEDERSHLSKVIRDLDEVPKLKALVGKHFKYSDSRLSNNKTWWVYVRIKEYKNNVLIVDSFLEDEYGTLIFEKDRENYPGIVLYNSKYIEIPKKVYMKALNNLMKKVEEFGKNDDL